MPDAWLIRLRALSGIGVLAWELIRESGHQWWVLVLAAWLLGAPLEELVRLVTGGRIQIDLKREKEDE